VGFSLVLSAGADCYLFGSINTSIVLAFKFTKLIELQRFSLFVAVLEPCLSTFQKRFLTLLFIANDLYAWMMHDQLF